MPDPSTQVPAPEQTQDPAPRHPRSPHSGPSSPFPQRCGHWSSKPHPVPDPGPSGLGPRGTPGVVVLRPVQDHVARDRQASPSLCISGNVVSQGHCGPRSRISREWDRAGPGGTQSSWHLWSQSCRTRPRTKARLSMSQSPIARAGWGWVAGSPIFPTGKMRLREGCPLAGDHSLSQWCSRLQNPRALLPGPEALTCLLRVGCRKSSPTGLGWQEGLAGAPRDGEDFDWL